MTPTDPDPTAAELARCVAWLRARAKKMFDESSRIYKANHSASQRLNLKGIALSDAADDLARGEQP